MDGNEDKRRSTRFSQRKITLLNHLRSRRWNIIGYTLRHNEELHSIILEGMIEGKRGRGRPRTYYISQVIKDANNSNIKHKTENHGENK